MSAPFDAVDLFAGPGGWDEGARKVGLRTVGLEWDHAACQTAVAAGHPRIRCDVAAYPTAPFVGIPGLIASPPCQAWSMAGKRAGEQDRANCHRLADYMAKGDDAFANPDWGDWEDPRSPLVCQPVRWVRELRPEWVALEEVPAVLGLWEHFARIFRAWGYSAWVGVLNAADYGVPQTRQRVILMASRVRAVQPPEPTHSRDGDEGDLFGSSREKWISMAAALGWEPGMVGFPRRADGGAATEDGYRERDLYPTDGPAQALTEKTRSWTRFVAAGVTGEGRPKDPETQPADTLTGKGTAYWIRMGNQEKSAVRHVEEPAPTVLFGARANKVEWFHERPATTVVGSFCPDVISAPGYRVKESRQNAEGGVRVTVAEGGVLQSFPADYPWQGSRTKQYQQVGNAVPPRLAAHVLSSLTGAALEAVA